MMRLLQEKAWLRNRENRGVGWGFARSLYGMLRGTIPKLCKVEEDGVRGSL